MNRKAKTQNHEVTGWILAGRSSRRMGQDKSAMAWGPRTLLEHMTALLAPLASRVRVLGPGSVPDRHPDLGPVEGVASALEATETDHNIIVALDLPFLEPAFLELLLGRAQVGPLVVCRVGGQIPLCLAIARGALPVVDDYLRLGKAFRPGACRPDRDRCHL